MELGISGRRALVTGGSLGIGRATAAELAAEGVDVAIVARDEARLNAAAQDLASNTGGKVIAIPGDMGNADDIARVIDEASSSLGGIDILVNNAGSSPAGRIEDLDDETWMAAFELKFMGYMRLSRAALPAMRAQGWGRIVNIIGGGGHSPRPGYILGGAYNAALINFTRALGKSAAPDGVLVNGINPSSIDTPRWATLMEQRSKFEGKSPDEINAGIEANIPVGRLGTSEDIAGLATFLCSERAEFLAAININADGGSSAGLL
ncbi:MAG: 3-oxoacyl-[acyl-carrier protein] reductase [Paracoccaceae bacterium]|jgi:3-oxoacyl-[acyl-carrier protein] reductase